MQKLSLGIVIGLVSSSIALAQGAKEILQLVAKVDPSVVMISVDNESLGSGFVIDESGIIATNYHVIEGAKTATVKFPANKDARSYPVIGFVTIQVTKDLALIKIKSDGQSFPALKLADSPPAKGERVFAFGSPLGLSGSVSDGLVSAVRSGKEVSDILMKVASEDVYKDSMGYDLDAEWLQITAPISPGNSGGPLMNDRGEVVGINTWIFAGSEAQSLNFSLSAVHLKQLAATAGTNVKSLSSLPKSRNNRHRFSSLGDREKTLAVWKSCNKYKNELNDKLRFIKKGTKIFRLQIGKIL
jgi:S1-C subfamily serine protease